MALYVKSGSGVADYNAAKEYSVGEKMVPSRTDVTSNVATGRKWVWECTTGGTTNGAIAWPASVTQDVTTITQNDVVFTARKPGFSSGTTANWAYATIYLLYAVLASAAGDVIYVSNNHSETSSAAVAYAFPTTVINPLWILCVDDSNTPPIALATTAATAVTGTGGITFSGCAYIYGISFTCGSGNSNTGFSATSASEDWLFFDTCKMIVGNYGSGVNSTFGPSGRTEERYYRFHNTTWKFGHISSASGSIRLANCVFEWTGTASAIDDTGAIPLVLFSLNNTVSTLLVAGVDLSALGSGKTIVNLASGGSNQQAIFRNCKLGADVTPAGGTPAKMQNVVFDNCDSNDTNYKFIHYQYAGTIVQEITLVRSGGASDGTTPISWKMVSNANAKLIGQQVISQEIALWNEAVGSSQTITIEILHDSATNLKDSEIWIELQYLGTSGFPLSSFIKDAVADVMATPADQASSDAVWTTIGMSNPNKQKLSVTITPREKGVYLAKVYLAKASYTVYIDPVLTIS